MTITDGFDHEGHGAGPASSGGTLPEKPKLPCWFTERGGISKAYDPITHLDVGIARCDYDELLVYARVLRAALEGARKDSEAVRELMNVYNLGGWTDAVGPMKRALAAEARLAECERDAGLSEAVLAMCEQRGWSLHWTHRGAYLHLEASELIEAIRGKHGDPLMEAADVLLVLMSITEYAGIPWDSVVKQVRNKCGELMTKPHYQGEEYAARSEKERVHERT